MLRKTITLVFLLIVVKSNFAQDVYIQYGKASFYADKFEGRTTASGEKYSHTKLTAAHLTLPFGTRVKVTNLGNKKTVIVKINDRGPFVQGRIIDLSKASAMKLDFIQQGVADVKVEVIDENALNENEESIEEPEPKVDPIVEKIPEFYSFSASKADPKGYGVQIGSFREIANLMKISEQLKTKYNNEVIIQVAYINKVKVYRVIVGKFGSETQAADLLKKMKKEYTDCFIVNYSKL